MKRSISWLVPVLLLSPISFSTVRAQEPSAAPSPVVESSETTLTISLPETGDGISLEQFIKICQENTKYSFTFTDEAKQNLSRKIRLIGKYTTPKKDFYNFFQTIMRIHEFVCVEMGRREAPIIVIMDLRGNPQARQSVRANAIYVEPKDLENYASQPGVTVTTLFQLKYQDAQRLQASLRQFMADTALEQVFNVGSSGLLVTSYGPVVNAVRKFLELIDVPGERAEPPVLEVIQLDYAAAEEIEPILAELIEKRKGRTGNAPRVAEGPTAQIQPEDEYEIKIIPDPRNNSLLVQAAKGDIPWVLDLVQRLDTKLEQPDSNFHIYTVRNVEAKKLADNLSKFLEQTQQAVREAATSSGNRPAGSAIPTQPKEQKPVVIADEQTNSIMVTASKTRWAEIKNMIERLDVRQNQVLIETALVELSVSDNFSLGVELAKLSGDTLPESGEGKPGAITSFGLSGLTENESGLPTDRTLLGDNGLAAGNGILAGYILGGEDVTLPVILSALKSRSNAKILSIPSVLVTNNYQAEISSKTYTQSQQNTTATNGQTIQGGGAQGDAGITLSISPSISSANYLRLNIDITVSSFGSRVSEFVLPDKNERKMKTSTFVPDGATLYIGGIVVDDERDSESGVPILMDIPLIGFLFRKSSNQNSKTTFYFFITPHIVKEADFADLLDLSYKRKIEADSVIGGGVINKIDRSFLPRKAPEEGADSSKMEAQIFEVPVYQSPSKEDEGKKPQ